MAKKETKAKATKQSKKPVAKAAGKVDAFRGKSVDELGTQLQAFKKEQFNLRFQRANGQVENTGRIMFEVDGVPADLAREALRLGAAKLPIRTRFVQRVAD